MRNQLLLIVISIKKLLTGSVVLLVVSGHVQGQVWQQPPRSQANLEAQAKVETRSCQFEQAGGITMEYGVYVPASYDSSAPTPLVIADMIQVQLDFSGTERFDYFVSLDTTH